MLLHADTAWPVQGTGASQSLQGEGGMGQNPLDKFVRQMALIREATITPSGMDEQLRWVLHRAVIFYPSAEFWLYG